MVGAVLAFAAMYSIKFVPNKMMVYLSLGLMPFAIEALPRDWRPNIEWRGVPFVTGVLTTVIQVLAGVGGLFLDIFFQKSMLDRKTTNATKATVQSLSHVVRIAYFGTVSGMANVPKWALVPAIALAIAATSLAPFVIERMTDHGFRQWTRRIIFTVSAVYLFRAGMLWWHGYRFRERVIVRGSRAYSRRHGSSQGVTGSPTKSARPTARLRWRWCGRDVAALSDFSSIDFAVERLSSLAITSPSLVLTTTRSPRRIGAAGDTRITSPSR